MNEQQTGSVINYARFKNIGDDIHDDNDDAASRKDANEKVQAAMSLLAFPDKQAFVEACERAPGLVLTESDPLLFLRFDKFDAEAAARRLARYWEIRKELFGPDRFCLPLEDLSGQGALSKEDVRLLRIGWLVHLPNDNQNRTVLYSDRSKRNDGVAKLALRRTAFFALHTALFASDERQQGLVWLCNLSNPSAEMCPDQCNFVIRLILKELPITLHQLHIICRPPENDQSLQTIVTVQVEKLRPLLGDAVKLHVASSDSDCLSQLAVHHLVRGNLPVIFGGSWTGSAPWQTGAGNRKLYLPIEPDVSCLIRNTLWYYAHSVFEDNNETGGAADGVGENKKVKKRKNHAINSKRRRAKEKIEHEVMFQEYVRQKEMNQSLRREQARLERLVQAANDTMAPQR